jgi:hypothetical protein
VERLRAEFEHRRKPRQEVKAPVFDFREVRDDLGGESAVRGHELRHGGEQVFVRAIARVHTFSHSTLIFELSRAATKRVRAARRRAKHFVRESTALGEATLGNRHSKLRRPSQVDTVGKSVEENRHH